MNQLHTISGLKTTQFEHPQNVVQYCKTIQFFCDPSVPGNSNYLVQVGDSDSIHNISFPADIIDDDGDNF